MPYAWLDYTPYEEAFAVIPSALPFSKPLLVWDRVARFWRDGRTGQLFDGPYYRPRPYTGDMTAMLDHFAFRRSLHGGGG